MNSNDQGLRAFLERAVSLGIHDFEALAELLPDESLREKLREAAQDNPFRGREKSASDIVQELLAEEREFAAGERTGVVDEDAGDADRCCSHDSCGTVSPGTNNGVAGGGR